jgi:hypothetical protein
MAELKAALGQRIWAEQNAIETTHPGLSSIQAGPRRRAPVEESNVRVVHEQSEDLVRGQQRSRHDRR